MSHVETTCRFKFEQTGPRCKVKLFQIVKKAGLSHVWAALALPPGGGAKQGKIERDERQNGGALEEKKRGWRRKRRGSGKRRGANI